MTLLLCSLPNVSRADPIVSPVIPDGMGVNIHFTDPRPGEMKMLAEAGFKFIRMDFDWARIEKERGVYDFSPYERLLAALEPHEIRALFILDYANPLYDDNRSPDSDEGRKAFARWAAAGARHFKGRGILWEMYNEPNFAPFWRPKPDTEHYIKLALQVGKAIREAAPQEIYIGPATSGVDLPFLEACFKAGLLEYWDAVSVHPYRQQDPEPAEEDYRNLRLLISKHAPKSKTIPILSGEWGYSSVWSGMDEDRQAKMLVRQWLVNLSNDVPLSIWYDWHDDGPDPKEPEHHFGTVRHAYHQDRDPVYEPKPAYIAAKTLIEQLRGFQFNKRLAVLYDLETYVLMFASQEKIKLVAWTQRREPGQAAVPVGPGEFNLTSHLGKPLGRFKSENTRLRIELGDAPIFIEPAEDSPLLRDLARWPRGPLERYQRAADASSSWEKQPKINRATQRRWISHPWRDGGRDPFFQRYLLIVTDPIVVIPRCPVGDALSVQIQNPSGEPFSGSLAVGESGARTSYPISLQKGDKEKLVQIKVPARVAGGRIEIGLFENGFFGTHELEAWQRLKYSAVDLSETALSLRAEGDEKAASEQTFSIVDAPAGLPAPGAKAVKIDYRFDPGWKYICLSPKPEHQPIEGRPRHLGVWVKGDGSGNIPRMRFVDSTGQTFQPDGPKLEFTDWRYVEFPMDGSNAGHWGGAADGVVHSPIRLETILLLDSASRQATSGTVYVASPALIYDG